MPDWIDRWLEAQDEADPLPEIEAEEFYSGPPLDEAGAIEGRRSLSAWQSAELFYGTTRALCRQCASAAFFGSPGLKFLHDAHVLAEFSVFKGVQQVRLADAKNQWPDGFVQVDGAEHNVEITSTHGGRKLGEEYRRVRGPTLDPLENWVERANSIPRYLEEAIAQKVRKRYSSPYWLVVYLNISEYGIRQIETEKVIAEMKARYQGDGIEVYVIWKRKLY